MRGTVALVVILGVSVCSWPRGVAAAVEGITPLSNAIHVDPEIEVTVTFDQSMSPSSINSSSFLICGSICGFYGGVVSYDEQAMTASFQPDSPFMAGEIIEVVLTSDMEALDATPLIPGYAWHFHVAVNELSVGEFELDAQYSVGATPTDAVSVDLDNDGDVDIACANYTATYLSVLINDGDGRFVSYPDLPTADQPISICAADFDRDGDVDLAAPSANGTTVSVHLNLGDGTFATRTDWATCGGEARGSFAADFDMDGDVDLAVGSMGGCLAILYNDGAAGFGAGGTYATNGDSHDLYAADFDGDGDLDIVASNKYSGDASVCFNDGSAGFAERSDYSTGTYCLRVTAADLDLDGDADFVAGSIPATYVFWNDGSGGFPLVDTYDVGGNPYTLSPGDFDGDQDLDILTGGDDMGILWNKSQNDLDYEVLQENYSSVDQSAIADLDGDGDLDLVITNRGSNLIDIYMNGYAAAPRITGIADVGNDQGRQVRISWKRSKYDEYGSVPLVEEYGVYRRIDEFKLVGWDYLMSVPARGDPGYEVVVPTLADSTAADGVCWSTYMVSAITSDPHVFFDSAPDSGYSVDNLAPDAPGAFSCSYTGGCYNLVWPESQAEDLIGYRVYRNYGYADFIPGPDNLLVSVPDAQYQDYVENKYLELYYYSVSAYDDAGNQTFYGAPYPTDIPSDIVSPYMLLENHPNPFNPSTEIRYRMNEGGIVELGVYDLSGRHVRTLVHASACGPGDYSVPWNGEDERGLKMGSGTYFCRMRVGGYEDTIRMLLLK